MESNKFSDIIFENSPYPMWISDGKGTLLRLNQACRDLLHIKGDEVIGKYNVLQDEVVEEQGLMPLVRQVFDNGKPVRFTFAYDSSRLKNLDLKERVSLVLDVTISPVLNNRGKVTHAIVQHIDITERRRAEELLRESENKYRSIFETTGAGTIIVEEDMTISLANAELEKLTGYSRAEVEGKKKWTEFVAEEDLEVMKKNHYARRNDPGSAPRSYEFRLLDRQGNVKNVLLTVAVIPGTKKSVASILDISERKRAEEEFRASEQTLRRTFDQAPLGAAVLALDNRYLRVNAELCRITGYLEQELLSIGFTDITHPDDYEKNMRLTRQMLAGDFDNFQMDKRYIRKDGKTVWVRLFARIVKDASGKPIYFFPMVEDITDRKRAEGALSESQEKYRLVVENASDAIFVIQDGFVQFPNARTMELSGYTAEELSRMSFLNIVHPDDRKAVQDRYLRRIAGEKFSNVHSYRCINRSGEVVWVQTNSVPTLWNGRPATINFVRDITQEKKLEAHLLQAQKMEAIGTLAGGIAHDFNNILTAILGYAELADLELEDGSKAKSNLQHSIKASHRAKDLVQQILAFSRQGKQEKKPLNITPLIKEDLKLLRASLPATIEIRQEIDKDLGTIEADPTQIHQIMMNLGTNASHAMSEKGGILEVVLSNVNVNGGMSYSTAEIEPGSYLRLSVSDTGCGMSSETLKKIFDPYFTTKEVGKGTGLGLAMVHGIVKSYGGGIIVSSEPGKGSTFDIYFPRVEAYEVSRVPDKVESMPLGGHERVLLVDDEMAIVEVGRNILDHLGYEVVVRTSSVEALELFRVQPNRFDLVITDMTMPNLTGDRLAQELLKIRPEIPIILCTGFSERMTEEKAKTLGVREFVMKPLVMMDLALAIRRALASRQKKKDWDWSASG